MASKLIVVWIGKNSGSEYRSVPMTEAEAAEFSRYLKAEFGINIWGWIPA